MRIARRMIELGSTDEEILEVVSVNAEELAELHKEMNKYVIYGKYRCTSFCLHKKREAIASQCSQPILLIAVASLDF